MSTYPFPDLTANASTFEVVSNTDSFRSPLTGAVQTVDRTGERIRATLTFSNLTQAQRSKIAGFVSQMQGQANRVSLRDHSYTGPSGSLTSTDIIDVPFNATNWSEASGYTARAEVSDISVGIRATRGYEFGGVILRPTSSADGISTPTAGYSYAAVMPVGDARYGVGADLARASVTIRDSSWGNILAFTLNASTADRLIVALTCTDTSKFFPRPDSSSATTDVAGSSQDFYSLTVSRCLLVDNGVNAMTYSEQFDNAAWTKTNCSVSANPSPGHLAPDGTDTADELIEDTSTGSHGIEQTYTRTSAAEFWTGSVFLKSNTNQRILFEISSNGVVDYAYGYFDATLGTVVSSGVGGNATLEYASIHDCGNGWYRCRLTARLAATTSLNMYIVMCNGASSTASYTGDGSSSVFLWGADAQQGSQLGRYTQTTDSAILGTGQTGSSIRVKGLDASTSQQLLAGDQVEINGQLCILKSDVDGDESGCGTLEVYPRIRTATSDEDPVILYQPHGTFLLESQSQAFSNLPGGFSNISLNFIEDIT